MEIHRADINDSEQFDGFVERVGGSFLQTWAWGEFKSAFGWRAEQYFMIKDGDILATVSLLKKTLPLSNTLGYAPQGPAVNWLGEDDATLKQVLGFLKTKSSGDVFLRIDPAIFEDEAAGRAKKILKEEGFKKSFEEIQPKDTLILDLEKSEETLLSEMHQKGRYNIRLAQKKGVRVEEEASSEHIARFARIYHETAARDSFAEHNDEYIDRLIETFAKSGKGRLFTAWHGNTMLAGIFVILFGKTATYLYGASSNESRELMPNHALQWHAIRSAKEKGFKRYDFWGIAEDDRPNHPWAGITRFKKQFGGKVVRYIGAFDHPFKKAKYLTMKNALKIRKKIIEMSR